MKETVETTSDEKSGIGDFENIITFENINRFGKYDVFDQSGRWCEGQVLKMSEDSRSVYVTYLYWDEKFDEWIDNVERRIAPMHTHTYRKGGELRVGQRIEVLDETNTWLEAFVIDAEASQVKVHYKGYHAKFDEWINKDKASSRIRPYGRHKLIASKPYAGPRQFGVPLSIRRASKGMEPGRRAGSEKEMFVVKAPISRYNSNENEDILIYNENKQLGMKINEEKGSSSQTKHLHTNQNNNHMDEQDERTRRISNLSEQYKRYTDALGKQNLRVVPVEGDGNCLFRAVAHQIYGSEAYHYIVREKCIDYMEIEAEFFSQFVEGGSEFFPLYLRAKRMDACWGDDPEIEAICELYNRRAEIWAFDPITGARKLRTFHETSGSAGLLLPRAASFTVPSASINEASIPSQSVSAAVLEDSNQSHAPRDNGQRISQSSRSEAPVIRLSYYGGGHYDSVVSPHHADMILKQPPGEIEDRCIALTSHRRRDRIAGISPSIVNDRVNAASTDEGRARDVAEEEALNQALAESRRGYLSSGNEDLEACLVLSMQEYAQTTGQNALMEHIPVLKKSSDGLQEKEGLEGCDQSNESSSCLAKSEEKLADAPSLQEGLIKSVQEQSEREFYENAILLSLQAEGKLQDTDLTEQELLDLVARESALEAEQREREQLEHTLKHSSSDGRKDGGVEFLTTASQPKGTIPPPFNSNFNGNSSSGKTTNDSRDIINLSDLRENDDLEYALKQSMEQAYGSNSYISDQAKGGFQTEDEMLHFALEASLQGYTSPNYADYKETQTQREIGNNNSNSHSHSCDHKVGTASVPCANSLGNSGGSGGPGFAVNVSSPYGGFGTEAEDMDEDLMRAIEESLKK